MPRIIAASLLATLASSAGAQALLDIGALDEIEDAEIVTSDGQEVGDIAEVLIDDSGRVVALVVETGGFLDIGGRELVFAMEQLAYDGDDYVTSLGSAEIESLPAYD